MTALDEAWLARFDAKYQIAFDDVARRRRHERAVKDVFRAEPTDTAREDVKAATLASIDALELYLGLCFYGAYLVGQDPDLAAKIESEISNTKALLYLKYESFSPHTLSSWSLTLSDLSD